MEFTTDNGSCAQLCWIWYPRGRGAFRTLLNTLLGHLIYLVCRVVGCSRVPYLQVGGAFRIPIAGGRARACMLVLLHTSTKCVLSFPVLSLVYCHLPRKILVELHRQKVTCKYICTYTGQNLKQQIVTFLGINSSYSISRQWVAFFLTLPTSHCGNLIMTITITHYDNYP
jgi:hypothetical protein